MRNILWLSICSCLAALAAADDDLSDFTNNLAQDLGPLLALFGEAVTKQYLSESTSFLDYFIFAMGPLGIITAVVSVIRVCGHPSLRAFIGRSQEGEAAVEAELCASTSRDVCELFHKGGIARVLGRPDILELVCVSNNARSDGQSGHNPSVQNDGASTRSKKLDLLQNHISNSDESTAYWKRTRGSIFSPNDKSGQLSATPNLSLNIGIKRPPIWVYFLVALLGLVLQAGVIILAGFGAWKLEWNRYNPDSQTSRDYAPRMFIAGSILLSLGMWGCAALIGQATQEVRYKRKKQDYGQKARLIWLQPGPQLVGDQSFDPSSYFESETKPLDYWISSRKRKGSEKVFEALTFVAVIASVVGYVLQFIGLRGMKAWLSLAQLGVTLFMSMVRGALRIQRLKNQDNKLAKIPDLVAGHELDWLAYELAFDNSPMQSVGQPQKGTNWHVVGGNLPEDDRTKSIYKGSSFGSSELCGSSRTSSYDVKSLREFVTTQRCRDLYYDLFDIRVQLAQLTGNYWLGQLAPGQCGDKPWKTTRVAVRENSVKLAKALGEVATALFAREKGLQRGEFTIPVEVHARTELDRFSAGTVSQIVGVEMRAPEAIQPTWRANPAQIEAILGLWIWSLTSSRSFLREDESGNTASNSKSGRNIQILAAGLDDEHWERDVDIEVELNFWFGPDTHRLSKENLRLGKGMQCDNFDTLCRPLTGTGGWDKIQPSSSLSLRDNNPLSNLKLFGWNILCENLGINHSDPIGKSNTVMMQSSQKDNHVLVAVQYFRSLRSITDLCTQQLFITLVKNLMKLSALPIPSSTVSEKEGFIQLQNSLVAIFEKAFVGNELGSRTDAITTIVPQLRKQLLPDDKSMISSLIQSARVFRQKGEWDRAEVLLKWGCRHFSPEHANDGATDLTLRWELFEKILRAAAEFYRCSAMLEGEKIVDAQGGLRMLKEMCRFISETPGGVAALEPYEKSIAEMMACYTKVFEKLATKPKNPRNSIRVHPLVQAIDDRNRVDTLYHLSFLRAGEVGHKSLKPALPLAVRNHWTEVVDTLLEMKAHPDSEDLSGRTGVSYCAEFGHVSLLKSLVDHGAFLDQSDHTARTPLHWAALSGQEEIFEMLLEYGSVDLSRKDDKGLVPLWHAIYANHAGIVRAILDRGFSVDIKGKLDRSPLSWAAENGQAEIVQHLIQNGAQMNNLEGVYHLSPLHLACENSHEGVVRILLEAGADPNTIDSDKRTPLHLAVKAGDPTLVRLLIDSKVDVDAAQDIGRTPLHYAADNGHDNIADILIDRGADVNFTDRYGYTPLHVAAENEHDNHTTRFITVLLSRGATIDVFDRNGCTPLHAAAWGGHDDVVSLLLAQGAQPNHVDKYGKTCLFKTASRNWVKVATKLLECGVDVNKPNSEGVTALMVASESRNAAMVQLLLENGAQVDQQDLKGRTAASMAQNSNFYDIVRLLTQSYE